MNKDLSHLKQGDQVVVAYRYGRRLAEIEKITPKGFIKTEGKLFDKFGSERGGSTWSRVYLQEATPEIVESIQRSETISKAKRLMESTVPTYDQALRILEIL